MASSTDDKQIDFLQKSLTAMTKFCPNWRDYLSVEEGETLCIPDCLGLKGHHWQGPVDETVEQYKVTGDKGEEKFLSDFRNLHLGGILLCGFNSTKLYDKMKYRKKGDYMEVPPLQEPDFIFFHIRLGILIVEVKGADEDRKTNLEHKRKTLINKLAEAANQIKERMKEMPKIYETLLQQIGQSNEFKMHYAIGLPFSNLPVEDEDKYKLLIPNGVIVITKSMSSDVDFYRKTMKNLFDFDSTVKPDQVDAYKRLAAGLIVGSSSVVEVSHMLNATTIHRRLDRATYLKKHWEKSSKEKLHFDFESGETTFFFTKEQTEAIEWHKDPNKNYQKLQIITGLPGTGKSLIWMVQALRAIRNGSRILVVVSEYLEPKFKHFFEQNDVDGTQIEFLSLNAMKMKGDADGYDLFMDEMTFDDGGLLAEILKARCNCKKHGCTTVIISGYILPSSVTPIAERLKVLELEDDCRVFDLPRIVRGTNKIIDKWTKNISKFRWQRGHKITGADVRKLTSQKVSEILKQIWMEVQFYTETLRSENTNDAIVCEPRDIAILVADGEFAVRLIRDFLEKEKSIQCQRIERNSEDIPQSRIANENSNRITVGYAEESLSHEWPVVIAVCFNRTDFLENQCLIARSRAIAKLTIINRDFSVVQKMLDFEFVLKRASEFEYCDLEILVDNHVQAHLWDEDMNQELLKQTKITVLRATIIRYDYILPSIREISGFEKCRTLSELFEILANNEELLTVLAICFTVVLKYVSNAEVDRLKRNLAIFENKIIGISMDKVPLFLQKCWKNASVTENEIKTRWKNICSLIGHVIQFYSENCKRIIPLEHSVFSKRHLLLLKHWSTIILLFKHVAFVLEPGLT